MASKEDNPKDKRRPRDEDRPIRVIRNAADLQRMHLDKLMRKPDKPAFVPDKPDPKKLPQCFRPPEFIRNIWGSSAGAGSGDFHVYRGIRRREYERQKYTKEQIEKEEKDADYQEKVMNNMKEAEERTAKKRAKRSKKKGKAKKPKKQAKKEEIQEEEEESESDNESETNTESETNKESETLKNESETKDVETESCEGTGNIKDKQES